MEISIKRLIVIIALFLCISVPNTALAELYGWTDENGVKHYSNEPPPEGVKSFTNKPEIQSNVTDADIQKNLGQQAQPDAPTPPDEVVSEKSDQGGGSPPTDVIVSDDDRIRRSGVNRHAKRERHERREERHDIRENENLTEAENQDRHDKPANQTSQHGEQESREGHQKN